MTSFSSNISESDGEFVYTCMCRSNVTFMYNEWMSRWLASGLNRHRIRSKLLFIATVTFVLAIV